MNEQRSDQEWVDFYAEQRGIYRAFVDSLVDLVEVLLDDEDITYSWVISFSRNSDDLSETLNRARRNGERFDNPLESPLRVAGVSIGIGSSVHAPQISDLIEREFVVHPVGSLSVDEAAVRNERLTSPIGSRELTYEFPHYLISLDERRLELPEWSRFAGLKVRLEVKTHVQDCWEDISDDLPFDAAQSYPAEVRDLLVRSAAGLAAIDVDLAEAQHALWRLLAEYDNAIAAGDLKVPVNGASLLAYVRTSELVRSLAELGQEVGLRHDLDYEPGWEAVERRLLWLLRRADVHTLAELEDFLKQATPRARDILAEFVRVATDRGFTPWALPESVVEWLWIVLHRTDTETISLLWYADEIVHALNTLIGNPVTADEPEST